MTTQTPAQRLRDALLEPLTKERHNSAIDSLLGGVETGWGFAVPAPLGGRYLYNRGQKNFKSSVTPEFWEDPNLPADHSVQDVIYSCAQVKLSDILVTSLFALGITSAPAVILSTSLAAAPLFPLSMGGYVLSVPYFSAMFIGVYNSFRYGLHRSVEKEEQQPL